MLFREVLLMKADLSRLRAKLIKSYKGARYRSIVKKSRKPVLTLRRTL